MNNELAVQYIINLLEYQKVKLDRENLVNSLNNKINNSIEVEYKIIKYCVEFMKGIE